MLANPLEYLRAGRANGWAVGGFNVYNLESARAVVAAATNLRAPVMIQTSEGAVKHAGFGNIGTSHGAFEFKGEPRGHGTYADTPTVCELG